MPMTNETDDQSTTTKQEAKIRLLVGFISHDVNIPCPSDERSSNDNKDGLSD